MAISGGGIAGLSLAAVLAERGMSVRVFERFAEQNLGAGIICFPNACWVLRRFGLESAVKRLAGTPVIMRRMDSAGEVLVDVPLALINRHMGAPSYAVLRADLHRVLSDFARERGVQIESGCEVEGVSPDGLLLLRDGRAVEADWIIGADGRMDSPLRCYVVGDNRPKYGGFVNWIGVARAEREVFDPEVVFDVWGCGERFGVVPISRRLAYFAGGARAEIKAPVQRDIMNTLRERFDVWPEPVAAAVAWADPESLREIYVHDHDPMQIWHRDQVLLVGDAAHAPLPTSGQGACQALEDASMVADLLDKGVDTAPEIFFSAFTERRRDKANAIITSGRGFARTVFSDDPAFVAQRNEQSRAADPMQAALAMAGLWSRDLRTAGLSGAGA